MQKHTDSQHQCRNSEPSEFSPSGLHKHQCRYIIYFLHIHPSSNLPEKQKTFVLVIMTKGRKLISAVPPILAVKPCSAYRYFNRYVPSCNGEGSGSSYPIWIPYGSDCTSQAHSPGTYIPNSHQLSVFCNEYCQVTIPAQRLFYFKLLRL